MRLLLSTLLALAPAVAVAVTPATPSTPYAGQQTRAIKALSAQEIADLLAGRGMGFAKAAELNGYPGPLHTLEHAETLGLSAEQKRATEALYAGMQARARELGRALVEAEGALERQFADGTITPATLSNALQRIGALQAQLREVHLQTHLQQKALLSAQQVRRYAELRGYTDGGTHEHGRHSGEHRGH
ncbi:MAG TPA: hypothetical protein VEY50_02000 [Lysobacter sp.]|nr:hypothetical protein [Lysobacter sp.]